MTFTTSGNTILNGTTTIVLQAPDTTASIIPGMPITGTDIAMDSVVTKVVNSTTVIMSIAATGSTGAATLTFTDMTEAQWTLYTVMVLLGLLPLQDTNSGTTYVTNYLSSVGGWVPDSMLDPTGPGNPANSFTPTQAAEAIASTQFSAIYDLNFQVSLVLNIQGLIKLTPGLSFSTAASSLESTINTMITDQINNSDIPLSVASITSTGFTSANSTLGQTTSSVRQIIATEISSMDKIVDYKATALQFAIDNYMLDNTWNVQSVYTETGTPIVMIITKYTDNTYTTLDGTNDKEYILGIVAGNNQVLFGSLYIRNN